MSEPEIVRVGGKPLRCHHCGRGRFYQQRVELGVPVALPFEILFGSREKEAVLLVCAGCGLGQLAFPGVATQAPVDETPAAQLLGEETPAAADESEPIQCLACGGEIPAGATRCPACHWTWSA